VPPQIHHSSNFGWYGFLAAAFSSTVTAAVVVVAAASSLLLLSMLLQLEVLFILDMDRAKSLRPFDGILSSIETEDVAVSVSGC
jgi:hypothetical protein